MSDRYICANFIAPAIAQVVSKTDWRALTDHHNSLAPDWLLMYDFRTLIVVFLEAVMSELSYKVKAALEDFWDERAIPVEGGAATAVDELVGPVESMIAVEVLVVLDKITGMKLPNSIIQAGGYQTRAEFVSKLCAAVLAHVAKKSKP